MPKNKKKESSSDSDSGPEDRHPVKKPKSSASSKDEEEFFILDKHRKISVSEFKGKVYVGIREFYEKDGKQLPSKKGISLSIPQWKKLLEHADDINEKIKQF
ncbi:RNA polymerase II transcriptional coactivator [Anopheles nili]|uniref:RNA polymerase II transcriptional coactivator n=1 Tax=Anopheles nili TaxID=185578 RepID=UPI00237B8BB9|nr:RNA polymerase II transcriptional coactivator [Anopheles nili]